MPTTKKTAPAPASKTAVASARPKSAPAASAAADQARAALQAQMKTFESGVGLLSRKSYADALARFREAASGPAPHIADKSRSYAQVCERRMADGAVALKTAEDHFNYGVERLNSRDLETARVHLSKALSMAPNSEHVLYTMSLCCGLSGDADGALDNLRRAIDLEPKNRILARQDTEFQGLALEMPALRALMNQD